jgi:hypothetical protein
MKTNIENRAKNSRACGDKNQSSTAPRIKTHIVAHLRWRASLVYLLSAERKWRMRSPW